MLNNSFKKNVICALISLMASGASHALPFNIVPAAGTALPTQVIAGSSATALYTITNNSLRTIPNIFVKYLPPNVTQTFSNTSCGSTFTLGSKTSCTLRLSVSGAVSASDPDPRRHLFVCAPDVPACAGTNFPLNVTVNATPAPAPLPPMMITAGAYNSSTRTFPMLARNTAGTQIWTYPIDRTSTLPTGFQNRGEFVATSCSSDSSPICIAAGLYDFSNVRYPLVALSVNKGLTWSYPVDSLNLPSNFRNSAIFRGASCAGTGSSSVCIAAGQYINQDGVAVPMLALSKDGGSTWSYPINSTPSTLPPDFIRGAFRQVSCTGNGASALCLVIGGYFDNSANYPLFAISNNGGNTWSYPVNSTPNTLPVSFVNNGSYTGASCSGDGATALCIASGSYVAESGNTVPSVALSSDRGVSFSYPINANAATLPQDFTTNGLFNAASCSGGSGATTVCVAAGQYTINSVIYPLLALSKDGGRNWTYPINSNSNTLPPGFTVGSFNGVSCSGQGANTACIAVGQYTAGIVRYPMVALTTDGGNSWSYPISSTKILPLGYTNNGSLEGASCSGSGTTAICFAAGSYSMGATEAPLITWNNNLGRVWSYPVDGTPSTLPASYTNNGFFLGVASANSLALPIPSNTTKKFGFESTLHNQINPAEAENSF
jgi:hypothetical protein